MFVRKCQLFEFITQPLTKVKYFNKICTCCSVVFYHPACITAKMLETEGAKKACAL